MKLNCQFSSSSSSSSDNNNNNNSWKSCRLSKRTIYLTPASSRTLIVPMAITSLP